MSTKTQEWEMGTEAQERVMGAEAQELVWDSRAKYREFYTGLREAFLAAGPPTYARLVVIMRRLQEQDRHRIALGASALQAMMSQGGKVLPRWATLSAVIEALRTAARETGLDPAGVGTVEEWHQRLLAAAAREATGKAVGEEVAGKAVGGEGGGKVVAESGEGRESGAWGREVPGDG